MSNATTQRILLGSTFPLSLVRRPVLIKPCGLQALQTLVIDRPICSFWGHQNTLAAASRTLGVDVSPRELRPALELNNQQLPTMYKSIFTECWVLSPDYISGYRPRIGEEVSLDKITGWQVLNIEWLMDENSKEGR